MGGPRQPKATSEVRKSRRNSSPGSVQAPPEDHEAALDVRERRRSRFNVLWAMAKLLMGTALVLGCAFTVAFGAYRFAVTSDRFAVHRILAEGSRRFSEDQLLKLAGTRRGANLFGLDLAAAERQLTENPWIASAKLSRKLPDTLHIVVTEYTAEAMAVIDGDLYLITREGRPIKPLLAGEQHDFPVVSGVSGEQLGADRARALERLALGVEILRMYARMPVAEVFPAQEVHLEPTGLVRLIVGSRGITLELGKGPFRQKLLMAARVMSKVRARGENPGIVFLDNESHAERVVVRMR